MSTRRHKRAGRRHVRLGALLLGTALLSPAGVAALKYKPKPDDTLSQIALMHYGNPKKLVYLQAANGISDPDKLPTGRALWIPTVWRYRVRKGDTVGSIAARYLKKAERADFLLWLNRIKDPKKIEPGTLLTIPFLLRHRAQQGQTMVDVARRYYFSSKPTGLLRRFNKRRTNALKAGEIVWVPIYDPEAAIDKVRARHKRFQQRQRKLAQQARELARRAAIPKVTEKRTTPATPGVAAGPAEPAPEQPATPPATARLIQKAFRLYREGEYEMARATLEGILEANDSLEPADEAEAREILAQCLVALDRPREAEHEFVRLLMVAPERTLDPVTTSPKVMEVFKRAKGAD